MYLKVVLPYRVFKEIRSVERLVVRTNQGAYGLLPNRLDMVAVLTPGILTYQVTGQEEAYMAVDAGLLVKHGQEVVLSVRHANESDSLQELHDHITKEFMEADIRDAKERAVLREIESSLIRRLMRYSNEK